MEWLLYGLIAFGCGHRAYIIARKYTDDTIERIFGALFLAAIWPVLMGAAICQGSYRPPQAPETTDE